MRTEVFRDGLQAVEWTVEERALAGLSDLEGVPWLMPMDEFFEAWVEMLFGRVSRLLGGHIRSGRKRETLVAMQWEPPSLGSQKFLLPDITVEFADTMVIIDAKYKRHWEEMQRGPWSAWEEEAREEHRRDLLQVLAYGNLTSATKVVVCLVYPCRKETWKSLVERGRDIHAATITAGARRIHLWLTAMPMGGDPTELSSRIAHQLRDLAS